MPGPSDGNAGYECDTNHGIARTNPAHTGCTDVSGETETPPETKCVPTEANNQCTDVLGEEIVRPPAVLGESLSAPSSVAATSAANLAATGIDVRVMLVSALALLLAGVSAFAIGRRLAVVHGARAD